MNKCRSIVLLTTFAADFTPSALNTAQLNNQDQSYYYP